LNKLISVVLSTFNESKYINETLKSILEQTYDNFEIVIIDDGSTDNTIEIIQKYNNTGKIRLYSQIHSGNVGKNLNEAIKLSKGEVVAIMGADDLWESNKLKSQMTYLNKYKCVCSNAVVINENGEKISDQFYYSLSKTTELNLLMLLSNNEVISSSVLAFKSQIIECGGFDEEYGNKAEDYFLWLNVVKRYTILYVHDFLVRYRKHDKNLSSKSIKDKEDLFLRAISIRKKYLNGNSSISTSAKEGIVREYSRLINMYRNLHDYQKAAKYCKSGIKYIHNKYSFKYFKYLCFLFISEIYLLLKGKE